MRRSFRGSAGWSSRPRARKSVFTISKQNELDVFFRQYDGTHYHNAMMIAQGDELRTRLEDEEQKNQD